MAKLHKKAATSQSLEEQIIEGSFDDELKVIVRACYQRRKLMNNGSNDEKIGLLSPALERFYGYQQQTDFHEPLETPTDLPNAEPAPVTETSTAPPYPIRSGARIGDAGVFKFRQKRWFFHEILNKPFRMTGGSPQLDNVLIELASYDEVKKRFLVRVLEDPGRSGLVRRAYVSGNYIELTRATVYDYWLGLTE